MHPADDVCVYREETKRLDGPFQITKVSEKIRLVANGEKVRTLNITAILPMPPSRNDTDVNTILIN